MGVYKRGDVWWYEFVFNSRRFRESTKQSNMRVAEQMEAARKTELAKGEVGLKDPQVVPTVAQFSERHFVPFIEAHNTASTQKFYKERLACLAAFPRIWSARLDEIDAEDLTAFIRSRQVIGAKTSTSNRDLATLRRLLRLAVEWRHVSFTALPKIRLQPGEARRERVVTTKEEAVYLDAAAPLLRDFAMLEFDCGLRPEEAHRLKWEHLRGGNIDIFTGKTKNARRSVPASERVLEMFERRKTAGPGEWVFPAPTQSGHINEDSLKKQHAAAIEEAKIAPFVVYSLRHTCLTRWAESGMNPHTLMYLAGHASFSTTLRYIHVNNASAREEVERVRQVQAERSRLPTNSPTLRKRARTLKLV